MFKQCIFVFAFGIRSKVISYGNHILGTGMRKVKILVSFLAALMATSANNANLTSSITVHWLFSPKPAGVAAANFTDVHRTQFLTKQTKEFPSKTIVILFKRLRTWCDRGTQSELWRVFKKLIKLGSLCWTAGRYFWAPTSFYCLLYPHLTR